VPETAGVALEDMDRVFGSEVGREDAARRREVRVALFFCCAVKHR
jgi:hypothetical protein